MEDPYQVPHSELVPAEEQNSAELKAAVRHWERLRIIYNLCLIPAGLLISFPFLSIIGIGPYLSAGMMYVLGANVCYCLGPVGEVYLSVFTSLPVHRLRMPLFVIGTAGSVLLTLLLGIPSWW